MSQMLKGMQTVKRELGCTGNMLFNELFVTDLYQDNVDAAGVLWILNEYKIESTSKGG